MASEDELVETVARALCRFNERPCPGTACGGCSALARAALSAIREAGYVVADMNALARLMQRLGASGTEEEIEAMIAAAGKETP